MSGSAGGCRPEHFILRGRIPAFLLPSGLPTTAHVLHLEQRTSASMPTNFCSTSAQQPRSLMQHAGTLHQHEHSITVFHPITSILPHATFATRYPPKGSFEFGPVPNARFDSIALREWQNLQQNIDTAAWDRVSEKCISPEKLSLSMDPVTSCGTEISHAFST